MAGESEEPPREEEPDAIPPRAATTTLGDAETKLALFVPRPDGDASAGDAQRASKAAMAEAAGGGAKRREAEQGRTAREKNERSTLSHLAAWTFFVTSFCFSLSPFCLFFNSVLLATPACTQFQSAPSRKKRRPRKITHFPPAKNQKVFKQVTKIFITKEKVKKEEEDFPFFFV